MYQQQPVAPMRISTTVDLSIQCQSLINKDLLSKSDPACIVSLKNNITNQYKVIGFTERIKDNLNPTFVRGVKLEYKFEEQQLLRFDVWDIDREIYNGKVTKSDDFLGRIDIQLAEICGARGQAVRKHLLRKNGKPMKKSFIIIRADDRNVGADEDVTMAFVGVKLKKMDLFGKSDPFFLLKKNVGGRWTTIYKSEILKKTLNPRWHAVTVHLSKLCNNGDKNDKFLFECYDWDKNSDDDLIGSAQMSVNELLQGRTFLLHVKKKKKVRGTIHCQCSLKRNWKFYDYLKGGMEISLVAAIDFTGSNGNPRQPGTLHYTAPGAAINDYEQAIRSVGEILCNYDADNLYPTYGFGAKLPTGKVSHCFAVNGNPQNPNCVGVEGILFAYKQCLLTVQLYGPTYFEHIVKVAIQHACQDRVCQDVQKYFVLLILTDGVINDLQKTIAQIVKASSINLSVVIVGVGDANFKAMDALDADDGLLKTSKGKKAARDIVQFVPFNKVKSKGYMALAKETLAEIPQQVVDFFLKRGIIPNERPQVNWQQQMMMQQQQQQQMMMMQQQQQQQMMQQQQMQQQQQPPQQQQMMQPQPPQQQQMMQPQPPQQQQMMQQQPPQQQPPQQQQPMMGQPQQQQQPMMQQQPPQQQQMPQQGANKFMQFGQPQHQKPPQQPQQQQQQAPQQQQMGMFNPQMMQQMMQNPQMMQQMQQMMMMMGQQQQQPQQPQQQQMPQQQQGGAGGGGANKFMQFGQPQQQQPQQQPQQQQQQQNPQMMMQQGFPQQRQQK